MQNNQNELITGAKLPLTFEPCVPQLGSRAPISPFLFESTASCGRSNQKRAHNNQRSRFGKEARFYSEFPAAPRSTRRETARGLCRFFPGRPRWVMPASLGPRTGSDWASRGLSNVRERRVYRASEGAEARGEPRRRAMLNSRALVRRRTLDDSTRRRRRRVACDTALAEWEHPGGLSFTMRVSRASEKAP